MWSIPAARVMDGMYSATRRLARPVIGLWESEPRPLPRPPQPQLLPHSSLVASNRTDRKSQNALSTCQVLIHFVFP
jgi:hypothetical protein